MERKRRRAPSCAALVRKNELEIRRCNTCHSSGVRQYPIPSRYDGKVMYLKEKALYFQVITLMTTFEDREDGAILTKHIVALGSLRPNPSKWPMSRWEGMGVIRASRGAIHLCFEIDEFQRCTKLTASERKSPKEALDC
jgi:hypothetical protein